MTAEVLAWLLGLGGIAAGFATGYFVARHRSTDVRRQLETEQRLQEAEERLGSYREEVEGHFRTTADLVNRLTSDYRDVHNHLAAGARQLCGESGNDTELLESLATPVAPPEQAEPAAGSAEPPLDYAPRRDPEEPGVLTEEYGFEKSTN